jgi:hypothetical protein
MKSKKQIKCRSNADQVQIKGFPAEAGPTVEVVPPFLIVPTLRVVTPPRTLRVPQTTRIHAWGGDAERHRMHSHAERGHDQKNAARTW